MRAERWTRVEGLFHRALEMDEAARAEFLRAECGGDAELRREVERLLAADAEPHELVERFEGGALRPTEDPLIGREIGAYRLTGRVATGGMGVVYSAQRSDGLYEREVAIKLIRIELSTPSLVRRFELERRTLAALHHPNIAALMDGGATPEGRPYLVMELVRGVAIDRYCEQNRLDIADRLRLFAKVCRAVHFAHKSLIVHRDLKPGNILIDQNGEPKLLDFGIARILEENLDPSATALTVTLGHALTPDYASPEQINRGPVTTSMDVYSLGVLLYELLTGRRPFPSENRTPVEWHRAVLETPPTRPSSTALWPRTSGADPAPSPRASGGDPPAAPSTPGQLALHRRGTPRSLRRWLRGDLDRIVLMALRKEPERRYSSADEFADDIEHHLSGHPVQARPDSFAYRASKFVQRNRVGVVSAVFLVLALTFGVVAATLGERHAREQAAHARIEADSFREIAGFLMDAFLTSAGSMDDAQRDAGRRRILGQADRVRREHAEHGHLRANLLDSLGQVAQRLGYVDDAESLADEAKSIREVAFGTHSLEYALSLRTLGHLAYAQGQLAHGAEYLAGALAIHRASPEETHTDVPSAANDLAACLRGLGRLDEAYMLHTEALALRRAVAPDSLATSESLNNLAGVEIDRGDLARAAELLEESLAIRRRVLGANEMLTLQSMGNLANTLWRMNERERAHALMDEAVAGCRALRVDGKEELAQTLSNLAGMWIAEKEYAKAELLLSEAIELQERRLGPTHPAVATSLTRNAQIQEVLGRTDEARGTWQRVLTLRRDPQSSPRYLAQALTDFGTFLTNTHAPKEASAAYSEAIELFRSSGSTPSPWLPQAEMLLGESLLALGDADGARPHFDEAVAIYERDATKTAPLLERARAGRRRCDEPTAGAPQSGGE